MTPTVRHQESVIIVIRTLVACGALLSALSMGLPSVHAATDPRVAAFTHLELSNRSGSGNLPHDCATLAGDHVCLPHVTFDKQRVPDLTVLNGDVAYAVGHNGMKLAAPPALHVGIATAIFQWLVVAEGKRDGVVVTIAEATLVAKSAMASYQKQDPNGKLPGGLTPKQFFLSATTIDTYRRNLIYTAEIKKITKGATGAKAATRDEAWYRARLPRHSVTINGKKPGFNLPASLH
jgi:hypothetical protein